MVGDRGATRNKRRDEEVSEESPCPRCGATTECYVIRGALATVYCHNIHRGSAPGFARRGKSGDFTRWIPGAEGDLDDEDDEPTRARPSANGAAPRKPRKEIVVSADEMEVTDAAIAELARCDDHVYQRGGQLVRVAIDDRPERGIVRPTAPRIEPLPLASLGERMADAAAWRKLVKVQGRQKKARTRPPAWCRDAVAARGTYPGIRHLEGVVEYPVLRPDGTLLTRTGYDRATGLLYRPSGPVPSIPESPTRRDAQAAMEVLWDVVADFPFAATQGKRLVYLSAWHAALLTPLARHAIDGPTPLFLLNANVRGSGKTLLQQIISYIVTGGPSTVAAYTDDGNELRKRITSIVMGGDRMVLFDNIGGDFGGPELDAALTAPMWTDRALGVNRMVSAPVTCCWFGTANNAVVAADTGRRTCCIRLESPLERPEDREGLRYPNLLAHVREHRGKLLAAALTILRAFYAAGAPDQKLPPIGSFEAWSAVVRNCLVWLGLDDPRGAWLSLHEQADTVASDMAALLRGLERLIVTRRGLIASQIIEHVKPRDAEPTFHAAIRAAIESLCERFDSRHLGALLRKYRRRLFGGLFVDVAGVEHHANAWRVYTAEEFSRPPEGSQGS